MRRRRALDRTLESLLNIRRLLRTRLEEGHLAFVVAPCLGALGRHLQHSHVSLRLLMSHAM